MRKFTFFGVCEEIFMVFMGQKKGGWGVKTDVKVAS